MKYRIFKLNFTGAVHFGEGGLTTSADTLMADTVFAALCSEAAEQGEKILEKLVVAASSGGLLLSDGLPFIGQELYVPRPMLEIRGREEGDSSIKKALKKLRYIPLTKLDAFLKGTLDINAEAKAFHDGFSLSGMLEKVTVPEDEITKPYAVAVRQYRKGSGLYLCVGYETEETGDLVSELLESLSYSGIGGERSLGYGRFGLVAGKGAEPLFARLRDKNAKRFMSLSVCLPREEEIDDIVPGADYLAVKRSGWISSPSYAETLRKKKEIYMMAAGAVFSRRFKGDVFDVSEGGRHPVYRYGKPMLMGIS